MGRLWTWLALFFLAVLLAYFYLVFFRATPAPADVPPAVQRLTIIDEMDLGDGERLRLVEIPDRVLPFRCVLLTTKGGTRMACPGEAAAPIP